MRTTKDIETFTADVHAGIAEIIETKGPEYVRRIDVARHLGIVPNTLDNRLKINFTDWLNAHYKHLKVGRIDKAERLMETAVKLADEIGLFALSYNTLAERVPGTKYRIREILLRIDLHTAVVSRCIDTRTYPRIIAEAIAIRNPLAVALSVESKRLIWDLSGPIICGETTND